MSENSQPGREATVSSPAAGTRARRHHPRPRPSTATRGVHPGSEPHGSASDDGPPRLYTPAEAAQFLRVPESWLRRQAGQRRIPCTYLGKHLRFSVANLRDIADAGSRPPRRRAR